MLFYFKMKKLKLLCPNKSVFSESILYKVNKIFDCKLVNINQSKFNKVCHKYDIILTRHTHDISYKKKSNIKFILSPTTGLNHIEKKILYDKKIKIFYLKNKSKLDNIPATAEYTIFLILYLLRKSSLNTKFGLKKTYNNICAEEIYKKKIGIIGLGRIGKKVKKILNAFSAIIKTFDINNSRKNLRDIFSQSDIITLHIDGNIKNYNFINYSLLKLMKPKSILINTARGEIINESHLIKVLKNKEIRLGLDVIKNENKYQNLSSNEKIKKNKNIIISPHIAGLTKESIKKTDNLILQNFLNEFKNR